MEKFNELEEMIKHLIKGFMTKGEFITKYKNSFGSEIEEEVIENLINHFRYKKVFFISKLFGFLWIDEYQDSPTIYAKKNMCKDSSPIRITFFQINQDKYEYNQYTIIMNKCVEILDKYDYLKKTGKKELIKSYQEKRQMLKIINENITEIEDRINKNLIDEEYRIDLKHLSEVFKIKNIIQSNEPSIMFSFDNENIAIDLYYKLSISDDIGEVSIGSVSVRFNEELKIIDIYRPWL